MELSFKVIPPDYIPITLPDGEVYKQVVVYEHMLPKCSSCGFTGHQAEQCKKPKKGNTRLSKANRQNWGDNHMEVSKENLTSKIPPTNENNGVVGNISTTITSESNIVAAAAVTGGNNDAGPSQINVILKERKVTLAPLI